MTVRGGGVPTCFLGFQRRKGEWVRRFGASLPMRMTASWFWTHRIQGCGATEPRPKAGSPLIVIPIALSVPSCSKLSRYGLASLEHAARLARRPTLTAPARDDVSEPRVGTKKRALRSNKETDERQKICRSANSLTKNAPYKETAGGRGRWCVRSYGGLVAGALLPKCVERVFGKRSRGRRTRSTDRDRRNRRCGSEIERQDGCP
jgi:hypothetical protein